MLFHYDWLPRPARFSRAFRDPHDGLEIGVEADEAFFGSDSESVSHVRRAHRLLLALCGRSLDLPLFDPVRFVIKLQVFRKDARTRPNASASGQGMPGAFSVRKRYPIP